MKPCLQPQPQQRTLSRSIHRQPVPHLVEFAEGLPKASLVLRIQLQAQPLQLVSLPHVLYKAPAGVHQPYMAVPRVGDLVGDLQHKRAAGGSMHLIDQLTSSSGGCMHIAGAAHPSTEPEDRA